MQSCLKLNTFVIIPSLHYDGPPTLSLLSCPLQTTKHPIVSFIQYFYVDLCRAKVLLII